jgi:hypothetical protein
MALGSREAWEGMVSIYREGIHGNTIPTSALRLNRRRGGHEKVPAVDAPAVHGCTAASNDASR